MIEELGPLLEGRYRIESELGHGGMALVSARWTCGTNARSR